MNFPRLELTNAALDAVAKSVYDGSSADPIIFTCVKIGSKTWSGDIKTATKVQTVKMVLEFTGVTVADGLAKLTFLLSNLDVETGFYIREIGVFAKVGEEGDEFMFAYANAGSKGAYLKPYTDDTVVTYTCTINVAIWDAENVTAIIGGAVGYVTQQDFDAHVNDHENPHEVTAAQVGLGLVVNAAPSDYEITFTETDTLQNIVSGSTLAVLFGRVAKAIRTLVTHIQNPDNPHGVTWEQAGAAQAEHDHDAGDITSGVLAIARGGTGVGSLADLRQEVRRTVTYATGTLVAQNWSSGTYSLGFAGYNVEIGIAPTATPVQAGAFARARLAGSATNNTLTALGAVPEIDIPVIIRAEEV